MIINYGNVKST